jgi:hypothetical protein
MTSLPYSIRPKTGPGENDARPTTPNVDSKHDDVTPPMNFSKSENSLFNTEDRRDVWLDAAIKTLGGQHA